MRATYLNRATAHFREDGKKEYDIAAEVETAKGKADVRQLVPLNRAGIQHLSRYWPPVKNEADLDELPAKLKGNNELGFSPLYDPNLIEACCQRGIFPLTVEVGDDFFVFAPKLHVERCLCALADGPAQRNTIGGFPFCEGEEGIFDEDRLGVSKKLTRSPNETTKRPAFEVYINREEDLVGVFTLIRRQHGENWLCQRLRICLLHMFFNPAKYATKIVVTAIRRRQYGPVTAPSSTQTIEEGELVAGEVGYLVGDVYASATGAYCISGGGALQLRVTGMCMKAAGCKVWDLGMMMDYKRTLSCVPLPRKKWQKLIAARRTHSTDLILASLQELHAGRSVCEFFKSTSPPAVADPNSKAQRKKRQKKEAAIQRKAERKSRKC